MKYLFYSILFLFSSASVFAQSFTLKSKEISGQLTKKQEFVGFGCDGQNISPQLYWENPPEGTKSFAVTVYDPDAPTGSGWWHWVILNIPANVNELKSNAGDPTNSIAPEGTLQTRTDYGKAGFGGACPPRGHGLHKYEFTVYALKKEKLNFTSNIPAAQVNYMIKANSIGQATLVSYYKRDRSKK